MKQAYLILTKRNVLTKSVLANTRYLPNGFFKAKTGLAKLTKRCGFQGLAYAGRGDFLAQTGLADTGQMEYSG